LTKKQFYVILNNSYTTDGSGINRMKYNNFSLLKYKADRLGIVGTNCVRPLPRIFGYYCLYSGYI